VTACPECGRRVLGGATCPATHLSPVRHRFCRSCRMFVEVEFVKGLQFRGVICAGGGGHLVAHDYAGNQPRQPKGPRHDPWRAQ
jgi:hypothetical protein